MSLNSATVSTAAKTAASGPNSHPQSHPLTTPAKKRLPAEASMPHPLQSAVAALRSSLLYNVQQDQHAILQGILFANKVTVSQLDSMDIQNQRSAVISILSGSHLALTSDGAGSGIGVSPRSTYFTSAKKGVSGGAPLPTPPLLDLGTALRGIIGLSLPPREPAPAEIQPLPSPTREKARATERFPRYSNFMGASSDGDRLADSPTRATASSHRRSISVAEQLEGQAEEAEEGALSQRRSLRFPRDDRGPGEEAPRGSRSVWATAPGEDFGPSSMDVKLVLPSKRGFGSSNNSQPNPSAKTNGSGLAAAPVIGMRSNIPGLDSNPSEVRGARDGNSNSFIVPSSMVLDGPGGSDNSSNKAAESLRGAGSGPGDGAGTETIGGSQSYAKYLKMVRLGLSAQSVAAKMQSEGLVRSLEDGLRVLSLHPDQALPANFFQRLASTGYDAAMQLFKPLEPVPQPGMVGRSSSRGGFASPRSPSASFLRLNMTDFVGDGSTKTSAIPPFSPMGDGRPNPAANPMVVSSASLNLSKYFKMLEIGISREDVKRKMEKDGVDPRYIDPPSFLRPGEREEEEGEEGEGGGAGGEE
eukprot:gene22162-23225_t